MGHHTDIDIANYRPDIDGLRGIAIIAAICFHAGIPGAAGGFAGIEIFFVVSGFVITRMILGQQAAGKFDLRRFYTRRILRLIPATVPVLFLTSTFSAVLMSQHEFSTYLRSVAAMALFCANFFFYFSANYFNPLAETQPLLHSWSLSVEEQFYLLWPVAMLIAARWLRPRVTLALVAVFLSASFGLLMWLYPVRVNTAFYMLPPRMWEFFVGIFLAYLKPLPIGMRARNILSAVGMIALIGFLLMIRPTGGYPNVSTVIPVLATAAIIAAGDLPDGSRFEPGFVNRLLSAKWLVWIGLISYSLYLWHWPMLTLVRLAEVFALPTSWRATLMLLAIPVAWVSYVWVERPMRQLARHRHAGKIATGVLLGSIIFAIGVAFAANSLNRLWVASPAVAQAMEKRNSAALGHACHNWPTNGQIPSCRQGPQNAAMGEWLVVGDSHADAIAKELAVALNKRNIALTHLSQSSCPTALDVEVYSAINNLQTDYCARANRRLIDEVLAFRKLDTLVIASHWPVYLKEEALAGLSPLIDKGKRVSLGERLALFLKAVRKVRGNNLRVLIMGPLPLPGHDVPVCVDRSMRLGRSTQRCLEQPSEKSISPASWAMLRPIAEKSGAIIVDSESMFCSDGRCHFGQADEIWWYDDRHLSRKGAERLSERMLRQLGIR